MQNIVSQPTAMSALSATDACLVQAPVTVRERTLAPASATWQKSRAVVTAVWDGAAWCSPWLIACTCTTRTSPHILRHVADGVRLHNTHKSTHTLRHVADGVRLHNTHKSTHTTPCGRWRALAQHAQVHTHTTPCGRWRALAQHAQVHTHTMPCG